MSMKWVADDDDDDDDDERHLMTESVLNLTESLYILT